MTTLRANVLFHFRLLFSTVFRVALATPRSRQGRGRLFVAALHCSCSLPAPPGRHFEPVPSALSQVCLAVCCAQPLVCVGVAALYAGELWSSLLSSQIACLPLARGPQSPYRLLAVFASFWLAWGVGFALFLDPFLFVFVQASDVQGCSVLRPLLGSHSLRAF